MSEPVPPAAGGGNILTRKAGGLPGWGWLAILGGTAVVAIIWIRQRQASQASPATSTSESTGCTDADGNPVDCSSPDAVGTDTQSQYEQITAQLTGVEGEERAILAWLKDHQGKKSTSTDKKDKKDKVTKKGDGGNKKRKLGGGTTASAPAASGAAPAAAGAAPARPATRVAKPAARKART
jgi:hypothetical protein